jgi:hypothetical protein
MPNYNVWTGHGERGIMLENDEEEDDFVLHFENYYGAFLEDTIMGEPEEDVEAQVAEGDLGQMLREAEEVCKTVKESKDMKHMLEEKQMLQWKASNGLSNKGFEELLKLIKDLLPEGNTLLKTTYEARCAVCPLGLEAQKIHA